MESLPYLYAALALLFAVLVSLVIWARRSLRWRLAGLAVGAFAILFAYFALADLLSRPKPVALEFAHSDVRDFELLYADWTEGEGIYVLLRVPGTAEPRYYRLPWAVTRAEQLQLAITEAAKLHGDLRMGNPFFDPDLEERKRLFYAAPPPPRAPKGGQVEEVLRYDPNEPIPLEPVPRGKSKLPDGLVPGERAGRR